MSGLGSNWSGSGSTAGLRNGAHQVQVKLVSASYAWYKSTNIYVENGYPKALWRYQAGGTIQSSPAADDERVYFGSLDGKVTCLDLYSGAKLWEFQTGKEVVSSPAVAGDLVVVVGGLELPGRWRDHEPSDHRRQHRLCRLRRP
jgi:outer membrane protein assembly factor BamB